MKEINFIDFLKFLEEKGEIELFEKLRLAINTINENPTLDLEISIPERFIQDYLTKIT